MREKISTVITVVILLLILFGIGSCSVMYFNSESWARRTKDWESNHNGGLERVVTVYSYTGEEIQSFEGKFDISEQENEVKFDMDNGKRIIIRGGIVITEEK